MVGVARKAVASDLGHDARAACQGELQILQHYHRATLREDEAVASSVERARGAGGVIVAGRDRARADERGDPDRRDWRLTAARDDRLRPAAPDRLHRLADRV